MRSGCPVLSCPPASAVKGAVSLGGAAACGWPHEPGGLLASAMAMVVVAVAVDVTHRWHDYTRSALSFVPARAARPPRAWRRPPAVRLGAAPPQATGSMRLGSWPLAISGDQESRTCLLCSWARHPGGLTGLGLAGKRERERERGPFG
jgi:hypothetical protein